MPYLFNIAFNIFLYNMEILYIILNKFRALPFFHVSESMLQKSLYLWFTASDIGVKLFYSRFLFCIKLGLVLICIRGKNFISESSITTLHIYRIFLECLENFVFPRACLHNVITKVLDIAITSLCSN